MEIVNGESSAKKEALVIYYKAEAENQNAEAKQECIKGPWSSAEDEMLVELVKKYGPKRWSLISRMLKGRIGKQCRERWHNHLNPNVNKSAWTKEEDLILIQCHQQLGNQWAKIAQFLPGRTDNSIKNRWNSSLKRWQLMKTVDGGASDGEDYTMAYEDGGSSQGSVESQRDESLWGNTFYKHEASSPEQQSPDSTFWDSNSHVFVRLEKENKENQGEDEYVEVVSENEEDRAGACGGGGNVSSTSYSLPETSISPRDEDDVEVRRISIDEDEEESESDFEEITKTRVTNSVHINSRISLSDDVSIMVLNPQTISNKVSVDKKAPSAPKPVGQKREESRLEKLAREYIAAHVKNKAAEKEASTPKTVTKKTEETKFDTFAREYVAAELNSLPMDKAEVLLEGIRWYIKTQKQVLTQI